jgi:1-aminocyclopropane-1-carboxylate deaminase/D-cysteine desulfhydrase-like pyridoxal-dependent ACC family enzyme
VVIRRRAGAGSVPREYTQALERLATVPWVELGAHTTPVEEMTRLRDAVGGGPRLLVKRDDALPFAFGGNKVRKLEMVAAAALEAGADTLVTVGGIQSNHARVTAATAAKLGLRCVLIANGTKPDRPTANALLDSLLGAEVEYIASRDERAGALRNTVERLRRAGAEPFAIPLGASTPLGALGFVRAIGELVAQSPAPDVIVHATSSAGTQAGLMAGCVLHGLSTRVIGVSADDRASDIASRVYEIVSGIGTLLGVDGSALAAAATLTVDDRFVGEGYGIPTTASEEAQELAARSEALFVDHTYTAKALAALISYSRTRLVRWGETALFWHTGGQVGIFA